MNILTNPTNQDLVMAIDQLKKGNLVVYPTDTIYGIAADITNDEAIDKVFKVKQRDYDKPLSVCVHDKCQLKSIAHTNSTIDDIIDKLLPGPYTLLLKKQDNVSSLLTKTDTIGIRIPSNNISYELTKYFPITSTSANITYKQTPDNINDIKNQLKEDISVYIDVGVNKNHDPSTIIDLTGQYPLIVRQGQKTNELENILKMNLY